MGGFTYAVIWLVLSFFPLWAAWKKRWLACAVYAVGWLIFLYSVLQRNGGWDDLADFATLIVVVFPIYLVASIFWLVGIWMGRRKSG